MRPGEKTVPWLDLGLGWCSTFHFMLPGASSTLGQSGTAGTRGKRHQPLQHALTAATFLPGESPERPTYSQAKSGASRGQCHTQPAPEARARMHTWAFTGRMHRNNTCLATGSTNTHVHGHVQRWQPQRPLLRAHSSELTSPSPACKGWDVALPQRHRQGPCHVHSRSPAGTAWPPLQLCPRNRAVFAPLFLLVATTSPPKHLNSSGLA